MWCLGQWHARSARRCGHTTPRAGGASAAFTAEFVVTRQSHTFPPCAPTDWRGLFFTLKGEIKQKLDWDEARGVIDVTLTFAGSKPDTEKKRRRPF